MPKLHEIIAVDSGLKATATKINEESIRTFGKRDEHFVGQVRSIRFFAEEDQKLNTEETKEMVTTVPDRLLYGVSANVRSLDAYYQKEATNQTTKADLIVDGKTIAKDVPGTFLLGLETKLAELRAVYEAIPTLAPGPTWVADLDHRKAGGVFRSAKPDETFRSKKTIRAVVLHPPTEHHPAQVQAVPEDMLVAKISVQNWSGMMTSAQKSDLLGRIDALVRGTKAARQRANNTDVVPGKIGADLFKFIHEGIVA